MGRELNESDREIIRKFYDRLLDSERDESRQVGWRDRETQKLRFRILSEIGEISGHSVLDVGCGLCGYYEYLEDRGFKVEYTGYEIVEPMFEMAVQKHPGLSIHNRDLLLDTDPVTYDFVIMAGILSLKLSENVSYIASMLKKGLEKSTIGVAANFMGTYVDYQDDYLYYADPAEIFRLAKELTPRVTLRYDYMPYEFIVYLYRDDFPGHLY
jgi:SAM-dependent methyltransferase